MSKRVATDIVGSTLGVVSSVLSTVVVFILISRALGPEEFGKFAINYAIVSMLGLIFDFGYPVSLLRDTRKLDANGPAELPRQALLLKGVLFLVLTPFVLIAPVFNGGDVVLAAVLWAGIALISMGNFFSTMLRAIGYHFRDAGHNLFANLSGLLVASVIFFNFPSMQTFGLVFTASGAIYLFLTLRLWYAHCLLSSTHLTWRSVSGEFRKNVVYVLDAIGRRSFGFLDVIILGYFVPAITVGFYQAGQKVTQSVSIFAQPLNNVLLPLLARSSTDENAFRRKASKALVAQLLLGLMAGVALATIGPPVLILLFSSEFAPANDLLPYFAVLIAVRYATSALIISKTAQGFIRERLYSNLFSVLVLIIAGPLLGYHAGAPGVLIALIVSSCLGAAALVSLTTVRNRSK